ncbi:cell envelope integrity TolA C-terminal domain-containing protein [Escherichia coli]
MVLRSIWIEEQYMGVKKIVMLAILVSFVAGCAPLHPSNCHKTTALGSCSSGRWDDQDEWGEQARGIRDAINAKLDDPQKWKRKKCRLHMEFSRDGTALKISTSNGDKAYCEAIKSAAHKAKFPAFRACLRFCVNAFLRSDRPGGHRTR